MKYCNKFFLAFNMLILFSAINSCKRQNDEVKSLKEKEALRIYSSQTVMLYNSLGVMMNKNPTKSDTSKIIVRNYFPLWIFNKKENIEDSKMSMVASAFQSLGRKEIENSILVFEEKGYYDSQSRDILEQMGYNVDEIGTWKEFQQLKLEYFDDLEACAKSPGAWRKRK